jgi:hypothetical protein
MNDSQFIAKYNKFGSLNIPVKGNYKGSYDADLPQHELAILNKLFDAGKIELGTVSPHGASYTFKPAANGTIQVELYRVLSALTIARPITMAWLKLSPAIWQPWDSTPASRSRYTARVITLS